MTDSGEIMHRGLPTWSLEEYTQLCGTHYEVKCTQEDSMDMQDRRILVYSDSSKLEQTIIEIANPPFVSSQGTGVFVEHNSPVMAENRPNCFRGETMLLLLEKMLDYDHKPTVENTLKVIKLVGKPLTSSSGTEERNCHERLLESCSYISKRGSTLAAKYAVRALVVLMGHDKAGDLVDGIVENALEHIGLDDPLCGTAFKALGSAVEAYPEKYKDRFMDLILTNVIGTVLNENLNEYQKVGEDGILEDELDREAKKALYDSESAKQKLGPKCVARLMALRFIGVFCTSQSLYVDQGLEGLAKQFLDLLLNIIKTSGDYPIPSAEQAQFRVMAGCIVLKLGSCHDYSKLITVEQLVALSPLIHDPVQFVRWRFISRLVEHLESMRLSVEYMGLLALVGMVEDKDFRTKIRLIVDKIVAIRRKFLVKKEAQVFSPYHQPEYCLAYATYILSKQKWFGTYTDEQTIFKMRDCIWFLVDAFNNPKDPECLEFIRVMFQDMKSCIDATMPEKSDDADEQNKKMWALCDVAVVLLSYRVKLNFGGACVKRARLSKRFFTHRPSTENMKIYVPEILIQMEQTRKRLNADGSTTTMKIDRTSTKLAKNQTKTKKGKKDKKISRNRLTKEDGPVLKTSPEGGSSRIKTRSGSRPRGSDAKISPGMQADVSGSEEDTPFNKESARKSKTSGVESTAPTSHEQDPGTSPTKMDSGMLPVKMKRTRSDLQELTSSISPIGMGSLKKSRPMKRMRGRASAFVSSTPMVEPGKRANIKGAFENCPEDVEDEVEAVLRNSSPTKRRKIQTKTGPGNSPRKLQENRRSHRGGLEAINVSDEGTPPGKKNQRSLSGPSPKKTLSTPSGFWSIRRTRSSPAGPKTPETTQNPAGSPSKSPIKPASRPGRSLSNSGRDAEELDKSADIFSSPESLVIEQKRARSGGARSQRNEGAFGNIKPKKVHSQKCSKKANRNGKEDSERTEESDEDSRDFFWSK